MNKIVSNFYLIRLDGEPVYVGYTNRTVKQRFSEHKHDKDFGDIAPTVESLGKLEYGFTWDINLINSHAREVSDKETELILEYNTQDSVWQRGASGNLGGQTWANVKSFVKTNRDNPTFRGMDESDIMRLLEWQRRNVNKLQNMVNKTNVKGARKLENMVNNTGIKGAQKIRTMVNDTRVKGAQKLENMVKHTDAKGAQKLQNMVNKTDVKGAKKLENMVNNTVIKGAQKLKDTVNKTNVKGAQKLKDMVNKTNVKGAQKLQNLVNKTDAKGAQKLKNMVNHTKARS